MDLTAALFDLCSSTPRPIIAIDGPAGAGKTTLAEHLSTALSLKYTCTTIHMDDLYNGWDTPFDSHFTNALTDACSSHRDSKKFSLARFDWHAGKYGLPQEVDSTDLLILEGVGSFQMAIRPFLTVSIWIDINPIAGLHRVIARDGEGISQQMESWLDKQAEHFRENNSEALADFLLTTG